MMVGPKEVLGKRVGLNGVPCSVCPREVPNRPGSRAVQVRSGKKVWNGQGRG